MTDCSWISVTKLEIRLLKEALSAFRSVALDRADEIDLLRERLENQATPAITIGVYGGLVQWVKGNPFPIRVIDYDGDEGDLAGRDDEGLPCSMWTEAIDPDLLSAQG